MTDSAFKELVEIMAKLRSPEGCPWDREQTHESIRAYCIEEAYEVVEAIEEGDPSKMCEELGDLLLQVVFHAQLAAESKKFTITDVVRRISAKLLSRHPHVFRKEEGKLFETPKEVMEHWSRAKREEGRTRTLEGIPKALPALLKAQRTGEKAAAVGFDWESEKEVWAKVEEEMAEMRASRSSPKELEEEFGDLLFALSSLARHVKVDAESSLRRAVAKFEGRFGALEERLRRLGKDARNCSASELDQAWEAIKAEERKG